MKGKLPSFYNQFKSIFASKPLISNTNGLIRWCTTSSNEEGLKSILVKSFPNAKTIAVEDVSGGCGAMYTVFIESTDFKGLSMVKQHQAVTNALREQIKTFHGIRIETRVPKS